VVLVLGPPVACCSRCITWQVFWEKSASTSDKGRQLSLAEALEFLLNKLTVYKSQAS
jgi:hypothetical protein